MIKLNKRSVLRRLMALQRKVRNGVVLVLLVAILSGSALTVNNKEAQAICTPCILCAVWDTVLTQLIWDSVFEDGIWEPIIEQNIIDHLNSEENYIVEDFFQEYWLPAVAEITETLSALGMYQVAILGTFFDAKNYLETRRLYFKLHAEAHKDYHPSTDFCAFGTNTRSLASSESRANLSMLAMSKHSLQRHIGSKFSASANGLDEDKNNRWKKFIKTYCDPKDNGWIEAGSGLDLACDRDGSGGSTATGAVDLNRVNRDIDYTRLIDEPRTMDIDFVDTVSPSSDDEEDVMAMAANLYGTESLSRRLSSQLIGKSGANRLYLDMRSVAAKRNVAENSFHAIVSMKSIGSDAGEVAPFMAAIMKDLLPSGTSDSDIYKILGENPSYYAQLEMLGKKIYQNPNFFVNLYDKPANVARKSVAMKAIGLMLDRALFESELRQEMMLSVMLSSKLNENYRTVNRNLNVNVEH